MRALLIVLLCVIGSSSDAQTWYTDADSARARAVATNRPILLNFSGSDWCAPCKRLADEVFADTVFRIHARDHLVLLNADFPMRRANALPEPLQTANDSLAARYNPDGSFPRTVLLNADGAVLVRLPDRVADAHEFLDAIEPHVP